MTSIQTWSLLFLFATATNSRSFPPDFGHDASSINHIANVTYGTLGQNHVSLTSLFSPRMDFEQWKPLTGRGDPLRNDPTYDYEPPVLERVHYWADDTRLEREHFPERKSEVLMLGVSSKKPSITSRQPPIPPRRHIPRPPPKYEDYTYKLNDHYPMTILVPPPPPRPGHQPPLFILSEEKSPIVKPTPIPPIPTNAPFVVTDAPEQLSSLYALQESNLIYQSSSTTTQDWFGKLNQTKSIVDSVSSDYAGWGPTTPIDDIDTANETHNLIPQGHVKNHNHPYKFYQPMLSEAPPPPKFISSPIIVPTFIPTALPPTLSTTLEPSTQTIPPPTSTTEHFTETIEVSTENTQPTTTERLTTLLIQPTTMSSSTSTPPPLVTSLFDMLRPMMSMPMVNGPERTEDNLYAHASENVQIFNNDKTNDLKIQTMQTMQPPPIGKYNENVALTHKQKYHVNSQDIYKNPDLYTHGPYLHMRFTTPIPTTIDEPTENVKSTTDAPNAPMYLIIQGHSKVKTYSSKEKHPEQNDTITNEITKPYTTNEVKHLHPKMKKSAKKINTETNIRRSKAKNLKDLVDSGLGSIEIQEADVGIKYDISDGSDVPIEIYRKGIVDNYENDYNSDKTTKEVRTKRQIDLEDLLPFDEDTIEEFVYNFLEGKKNDTSITGLIAQAVTSDAAEAVDELEDDDDSDLSDEER